MHYVTVLPRTSRSSYANGRVERSDGVLKLILELVEKENIRASPQVNVARDYLLKNCIRSSKKLSAFKLVRGYRSPVSDIPPNMVSKEMIDAYISHESTRALNQMIMVRTHIELKYEVMEPGTNILVFYKSSKKNEKDGWIPSVIVKTSEHEVVCRRNAKGVHMNV